MKRKYELKRRAERLNETRNRIVEAAVDLHTSVGPAQTTISAIAARAGVERHTVYAHFPNEEALFQACSTHWRAAHPLPDPGRWATIDDPTAQFRAALHALYGWYEDVEDDLAILIRDSAVHGLTGELQRERTRALEHVLASLLRGWPRRKAVRAALGHALEFETWRSLVRRNGLTRAQAVDAMSTFVASV
jgi:AcrR family transcriptional regulator